MSWWCIVLAVDCVESLWVMILFLRSVLPILLLTNILRGSVAWSFGNTSRYRGRLLARCLPTSRWEINGSCQEVLQSWRWFFDHQDRCKITSSVWEELSKRQQVRRWKSCKHQHTSTISSKCECFLVRVRASSAICCKVTCGEPPVLAHASLLEPEPNVTAGTAGGLRKKGYLCHLVSWLCWHVDTRTWEFPISIRIMSRWSGQRSPSIHVMSDSMPENAPCCWLLVTSDRSSRDGARQLVKANQHSQLLLHAFSMFSNLVYVNV